MAENETDDAGSQEEGGKSNLTTIVLGALLAVTAGGFFYSLNGKAKLEEQLKTQEIQIVQQDSVISSLRTQIEHAEQARKRAAEVAEANAKKAQDAKAKKSTKAAPKKSKAKKK